MPINWRDVRGKNGPFLAEAAKGENCEALVQLAVVHEGRNRYYLVKAEVVCVGKPPWVYEKKYQVLPDAVNRYQQKKEETERRLRDNS